MASEKIEVNGVEIDSQKAQRMLPVSYTHLTLPTKLEV